MQHELLAAGLVEEALEHDAIDGRHRAEREAACRQVARDLLARDLIDSAMRAQPSLVFAVQSHARQRVAELLGARWSLAEPERKARRNAMRIANAQRALADAHDLPTRVAELKHVADRGLDREVLVDGANERVVVVLHDSVVRDVGDRAAARDGDEARALRGAHGLLRDIAVQQGESRSCVQCERRVEPFAREVAERMRAGGERKQLVF